MLKPSHVADRQPDSRRGPSNLACQGAWNWNLFTYLKIIIILLVPMGYLHTSGSSSDVGVDVAISPRRWNSASTLTETRDLQQTLEIGKKYSVRYPNGS